VFGFAAAVLYVQLSTRSLRALRYFTVWNWCAIVVYFFLASIASALDVFDGSARLRGAGKTAPNTRAVTRTRTNRTTRIRVGFNRLIASLFHALTPMTLYIDIITWTVLVPALMKHPDEERRRHWEGVMFSFISYAQHGLNALIMFTELSLNNIPNSDAWAHGVVCMWNILFALWSLYFFLLTGESLYQFLDYAKQPSAVLIALSVLFASSIGCSFFVQKIVRAKWRVVKFVAG